LKLSIRKMRRTFQISHSACARRVRRFNERFQIGQMVEVRYNSGKTEKGITTSKALHWGYNRAVVEVAELGFIELDKIYPITEA
jgi:hypothetical protein